MSQTTHSGATNRDDDLDDELLEFDMGDFREAPSLPVHSSQLPSVVASTTARSDTPDLVVDQPASNRNATSPPVSTTPSSDSPASNNKSVIQTQPSASVNLPKQSNTKGMALIDNPQSHSDHNHNTLTPREEHENRVKRHNEKTNPPPLGALGFNHNRTISTESATCNEVGKIRGLSSGSYGLSSAEKASNQGNDPSLESDEEDWQSMPMVASYDVYDEKGQKIVVKQADFETQREADDKLDVEEGGSKYGYTRVTIDEDVKSITSMDENTEFLFDEDDFNRSPLSQLENTKDMLTEGQRIAYVGLCKLAIIELSTQLEQLRGTKKLAKELSIAQGSMAKWAQMMMMRLYSHMDISSEGKIYNSKVESLSLTF